MSWNSKRKYTLPIMACIVIAAAAWLDPYKDEVASGNKLYHEGKFKDAMNHYRKAEKYTPTEKEKKKLSFNKGDADYMLGEYDDALTNFETSLQSEKRMYKRKRFLTWAILI